MRPVKNKIQGFMSGARVVLTRDIPYYSRLTAGRTGTIRSTRPCNSMPDCGDNWHRLVNCPGYIDVKFDSAGLERDGCWGYHSGFALRTLDQEE